MSFSEPFRSFSSMITRHSRTSAFSLFISSQAADIVPVRHTGGAETSLSLEEQWRGKLPTPRPLLLSPAHAYTHCTRALTPSASLTSSCKQVIYDNHFLSRFHGITLDFKFSLRGGKSSFILVLPYRETLQQHLTPGGTQKSLQRDQPEHSAPKTPKTRTPATGERHGNAEWVR